MAPALTAAFSAADFARLEAATRALASPLAFEDADAWRGAVMQTFCELLGAERASFHLPGQERPHLVHGMDDAARALLDDFMGPAWGNRGTGPDAGLDAFRHISSARTLEAFDNAYADAVLGGGGDTRRSLFWNEVVVPIRSEDSQSLFIETPCGAVQLSAFSLQCEPNPGQHVPLLRVLLPTLKAGLEALGRLMAHRAALDAVNEPLAVFDADGVETHRTPALRFLLACDPAAPLVEAALAAFAQRLRPLAFARRTDGQDLPISVTEVRTVQAAYTLRVVLVGPNALGPRDVFLVTVAAHGGTRGFPPVSEIRARHGLTEREAEVALLVAQGLSNDAIAERMFVSRHTVRHHVEGAMAKLEVTGRGREAVAARLLGADPVVA